MSNLLNINGLMEALGGLSRAQIYKLINQGLPVIKIGKNTRFDLSEVMEWIREQNKENAK